MPSGGFMPSGGCPICIAAFTPEGGGKFTLRRYEVPPSVDQKMLRNLFIAHGVSDYALVAEAWYSPSNVRPAGADPLRTEVILSVAISRSAGWQGQRFLLARSGGKAALGAMVWHDTGNKTPPPSLPFAQLLAPTAPSAVQRTAASLALEHKYRIPDIELR